MFQSISIHRPDCKRNCPGCYLKARSMDRDIVFRPEGIDKLLQVARDFNIPEVAMGLNDTEGSESDYNFIRNIDSTDSAFRSFEKKTITLSYPASILEGLTPSDMLRILRLADEIFLSVDTIRYPTLNKLLEDLRDIQDNIDYLTTNGYFLSTSNGYSLSTSAAAMGLAILMTPGQSLRLTELLQGVEHKFPGKYEYYLVTLRNVQVSEHDKSNIAYGFEAARKTIEELDIYDRVSFDHCSIMSMNGQKCGQHGMLDIDTAGGVRTCVYSREPTLQLSADNPISEFQSFLHAVQQGLGPEIDCTECPMLWKSESNLGVLYG